MFSSPGQLELRKGREKKRDSTWSNDCPRDQWGGSSSDSSLLLIGRSKERMNFFSTKDSFFLRSRRTFLSAWHPASLSINCSVRRRSYGSYKFIFSLLLFFFELTKSALIRFNDKMTGWVRSLTEFNKSVTISFNSLTCFASIKIGFGGGIKTAGNEVRRPFCLTAWLMASSLSKWYSWYFGLHSANSCCWRYSIVPKLARRWYLFDDEVLFFFIFTKLCFIC